MRGRRGQHDEVKKTFGVEKKCKNGADTEWKNEFVSLDGEFGQTSDAIGATWFAIYFQSAALRLRNTPHQVDCVYPSSCVG